MNDNPMYSGAMQGINLIQALRDMGRDDEMYKRNLLRQNALDSIAQSDAQMKMLQVARPADESGMVSFDLNNPARMEFGTTNEFGRGTSAFIPKVSVERPVNQQRRADLTGFDGRSKGSYELLTPEELNSRNRGFKGQDLMQELMMKLNLSEGQQQARARGQKDVLDYKDTIDKRNQAAEPQVDPNNLGHLPPNLRLSQLGPLANFINATKPHVSQTTNRETGDVIYTGVDRTGKPVTVGDPAWKGAAAPRKRQAPGGGKAGAGGKSPLTVTQTAAAAAESEAAPSTTSSTAAPAPKVDLEYDMATGQFKKAP